MEGRGHINSLFTSTDGTPITVRYVDKKRIQNWLYVNRVQFPLRNLGLDSNIIVPQNKDLSIDSTKNISKGKTSRELDLIDQINAEASKAPEKKLTNRAILVNALESTAQTDAELKRLNEYKAKVEEAEALEEHLAEVNKKINEITFTKGFDRFLLPSLKEDNKMLLRLESTQSLKSLLEREACSIPKGGTEE